MTIYHFTAAFLDQAVADVVRGLTQTYGFNYAEITCQDALSLLKAGRPGNSFLIDVLARATGLEPVELYSILYRRAIRQAGKERKGGRVKSKIVGVKNRPTCQRSLRKRLVFK